MAARREVCVRLLNDPTECVVIDLDRLPADAEDCATALQAELAPLESWIEIAEAYLVRGDERGFKTLMEMVCAPGACATRARRRRRARERERAGGWERNEDARGRGKRSFAKRIRRVFARVRKGKERTGRVESVI